VSSPLPVIAPALVAWQRSHGRHGLPWQQTRDPYRVWLSEVMLQQTQVTTVLVYYERFLQRFPTVAALAEASLDEVLSMWSGLGYYSRARNLHRCAVAVVVQHGGRFPSSAAQLAELPGIGPSTAAAIASFCFGERVSILDGNVRRVLGRVLAFHGDLAKPVEERRLWAAAQTLVPDAAADMPAYTQGLMDLGSGVCTLRQPQCLPCPLASVCRARATGRVTDYPVRTRKLKRGAREHWWLWLEREHAGERQLWFTQRPATGVWAGLWTLPLYDTEAALGDHARALVGARRCRLQAGPTIRHALTHFDWTLHPRRLVADAAEPAEPGRWVELRDSLDLALPAPLRRLIEAPAFE
jgi:A/G-specific adenine glycosylase